MFFVVRSNDSFIFPQGWLKYIVIVNVHSSIVYRCFTQPKLHSLKSFRVRVLSLSLSVSLSLSLSLSLCLPLSFSECSCTGSLAMRPQSTYLTCTDTLPHAIPILGTITLSPRIHIFKTSISFSGAYLWNNLPLTVRSCQSLSSFKRKLRAPWSSYIGWTVTYIYIYIYNTPPNPSDCLW